jgi:RNA polymerase sigma factor (sigma-70 family)
MTMKEELSSLLPGLHAWAVKHSGKHYDADDLLSDTIIYFLEHPDKYSPSKGKLINLLFSHIKNRSVDARRTYYRQFRVRARDVIRYRFPRFHSEEDDCGHVDGRLHEKVETGLLQISARRADAFRLFASGKSYDEIALLMNTSRSSAKVLIYHARRFLREYVKSA